MPKKNPINISIRAGTSFSCAGSQNKTTLPKQCRFCSSRHRFYAMPGQVIFLYIKKTEDKIKCLRSQFLHQSYTELEDTSNIFVGSSVSLSHSCSSLASIRLDSPVIRFSCSPLILTSGEPSRT